MSYKEIDFRSYEAPNAKELVVAVEENFMVLSNGVNYSDNDGGAGGDDGYSDGGDF